MKTIGLGFAVAFLALVSVILSEATVIFWLSAAPFDVTGNFFLTGVSPVHLLVQGVIISAIAPLLRKNAWVFVGIYIAVALSLYVVMLILLSNPMGDIIRYEISTAAAAAVGLFLNRQRIYTYAAT